jgi:hypothetical protein
MLFLKRLQPFILVFWVVGGILLIVAAVVWWNGIYQNPRNVFEGMLASNLATSSVTKHVRGSNNGQTLDQYIRLDLGSTNAARWLVDVQQSGNTEVTTDSIATPGKGYVRYTHITTNQKKSSGGSYDFSKILNVWGQSADNDGSSLSQLFSQTVLDVSTAPLPPIGNLTPDARQNLLKTIREQHIFTPDYKTVKKEQHNGRQAYTYSVSVKLESYVRMMQQFAKDLNLHNLDTVDPATFKDSKPITLALTVDSRSRQLVSATYAAANYTESYSSYGLKNPIVPPVHAIPVSQLQTKLNQLQ